VFAACRSGKGSSNLSVPRMNSVTDIKEIEKLVQEYYTQSNVSDPAQRKCFEETLTRLKERSDSWLQAVEFIRTTENHYLLFFSAQILEDQIVFEWELLSKDQKIQLRDFLFDFILRKFSMLPFFLVSKFVKLIVEIAKNDWPHAFPEYIPTIQKLVLEPSTSLLGVYLLKFTSEEFTSIKEDRLASRKLELKSHLTQHVSSILNLLIQLLQKIYQSNESLIKEKANKFDHQTQLLAKVTFETLLHLFGWIPLNEILTATHLAVIFQYVALNSELKLLAFDCINEVMSRSFIPKEFDAFFVQIFREVFGLLQSLTQSTLTNIHPALVEKFTLFTSYFVSNHLKRVEGNSLFPVMDFLSLLFKYTLMQPTLNGFLTCLDIWSAFLDYLSLQPNTMTVYKDGFLSLCEALFKKSLLTFNAKELNQLLNDALDENNSPFEMHVSRCIEMIGEISDLYKYHVLTSLPFAEFLSDKLLAVHQHATTSESQIILIDASTALRTLSRVAHVFTPPTQQLNGVAQSIIAQIIKLIQYSSQYQIWNFGSFATRFCSELFGSLRAFTPWLEALSSSLRQSPSELPAGSVTAFNNIVSSMLSCILTIEELSANSKIPTEISVAAAVLLKSIISTIRPGNIINFPVVGKLLNEIHHWNVRLPLEAQEQLYVALSNALLLPLPQVSNDHQQWDARSKQFEVFIKQLTMPFENILNAETIRQGSLTSEVMKNVADVTTRVVRIVSSILSDVRTDVHLRPSASLNALYRAFLPTFTVAATLLQPFLRNGDVLNTLMELFTNAFDALHSQLPSQFIEQTIKTFLNLIGSHLSDILRCNDKIGIAVVAKFFELLSLVVQKHTSSLIIDVTAYALSQRDLILMPETSPEVRENFYQLLYHILMHHLTIFQNKVEFRTFFSSIIDAFCRSFELVDIEIVRENLKRLESLDEKRKLFHLNLFRYRVLPDYDASRHLHSTFFKTINSRFTFPILCLYNACAVVQSRHVVTDDKVVVC
jgi:hypothetical protein